MRVLLRNCTDCCEAAIDFARPCVLQRHLTHGSMALLLHGRACCATVLTAPRLRTAARVCSPTSECAHWTRVRVIAQLGVLPLDCARSLDLNPAGNGQSPLQ